MLAILVIQNKRLFKRLMNKPYPAYKAKWLTFRSARISDGICPVYGQVSLERFSEFEGGADLVIRQQTGLGLEMPIGMVVKEQSYY